MSCISAYMSIGFLCLGAGETGVDLSTLPPAVDREIDFSHDVRPIFASKCLKCHGPEKQESGYRLDIREVALHQGDGSAPNIVPKKSESSPLVHYIGGLIDGCRMPPEGDPLSAEQIAIVRAWIDQGAAWPASASAQVDDKLDWWSLRPLIKAPPPANQVGADGPIDAFIRAKLAERGWQAATEADERTLLRRLHFDLVGLPPAPGDLESLLNRRCPDAYERTVDRLLASPRHGERWARHWMDAVHFAETHGHDQDRVREHAWPYRDWLIHALNADKPYDRFVQEQVAGDALFPSDPDATVALGFLAAGPWDESSLRDIREDTIDRQIGRYLDRDDVVSNVMNNFMSMTVQCARCHNHKFDPISQEDYYSLQAVFSGVERANRVYDLDPAVHRKRQALLRQRRQLERLEGSTRAQLLRLELDREFTLWEESLRATIMDWKLLAPVGADSAEGATLSILPDGSILATSKRPDRDTYSVSLRTALPEITGIRLETLLDESLPQHGPGRQDNGNFHLSEIELYVGSPQEAPMAWKRASASFNQTDWEVAKAIDGNVQTAWGIHPQVGHAHQAVFELRDKLTLPAGSSLTVILKQQHGSSHLIGRFRLSATNQSLLAHPFGPAAEIAASLAVPRESRTEDQRLTLAFHYERERLEQQLAALPTPSFVYAAASEFTPDGGLKPPLRPRTIHLLTRGDIHQPTKEARPGSLSCIVSLPSRFDLVDDADEASRRAALAEWLTNGENPLVWRSIVNRVWHHHFSRGLSATPNDFGRMGATPTHPELLDALAIEFRDEGRSLKRLHRSIVTSATYRQSSRPSGSQESEERDSENQLLWRMNRLRLDAESVRDAVLAVADRLEYRMGGPSDRQFEMRPGIHVTPSVDYSKFDFDGPAGRRRSIYRFLFRTLPDPFMESLDCPAGDQMTPVRVNSVTVQQALALWNDAFMLRHCEHLAARLRSQSESIEDQVMDVFRWTLNRDATSSEREAFAAYAERHGLENLCRILFNSNEFVYVD